VGVVCGGEVDGGGEAAPPPRAGEAGAGVGLIVNAIAIRAGLWGRWESLVKSINDAEYLMQIGGLMIEIQLFNLCWIILSDSDLTVDNCCGDFKH
jgi:hypothetical protein